MMSFTASAVGFSVEASEEGEAVRAVLVVMHIEIVRDWEDVIERWR